MVSKKKIAAIIATTAAVAFITAPLTATVASAHGKMKCYGVNSCKGKHNSCKGKGYKMMSSKACKKAGGSTEEPSTSSTDTTTTNSTTTTTEPTTGNSGN